MAYKTGKLAPKVHPNTLKFSRFVKAGTLPDHAAKVYREYKTPAAAKQFFGNDSYGDCTCAGVANLEILWQVHTGALTVPTEVEVLNLYSAVTGFSAGPPVQNDNGAAMTDVLNYWQTTGFVINGIAHKILGWAQIDHTNLTERQIAVDLFGATYVGVQLPNAAMSQFDSGGSWEVVPGDGIDGGHAIIHPGYGSEGGDYVTWAKWDQKASSAWESAYIDEEYVVITNDWLNQVTFRTPGGLDLPTLQADLAALQQ
jgi:hypothetical protein